MTNNQALQASNICGLLYSSKQITFGVATRLDANSKIHAKIMEQVNEIKRLGKDREATDEDITKELIEIGNAEFEGTFKQIDLVNIENLNYEEISVTAQDGKQEKYRISDLFLILQELNIVK